MCDCKWAKIKDTNFSVIYKNICRSNHRTQIEQIFIANTHIGNSMESKRLHHLTKQMRNKKSQFTQSLNNDFGCHTQNGEKKSMETMLSSFNSIRKFCSTNCEWAIGCGFFSLCLRSFRIATLARFVLRAFFRHYLLFAIYLCVRPTEELENFALVWIVCLLLYSELSAVLILSISNWNKRRSKKRGTVKWNLKLE